MDVECLWPGSVPDEKIIVVINKQILLGAKETLPPLSFFLKFSIQDILIPIPLPRRLITL